MPQEEKDRERVPGVIYKGLGTGKGMGGGGCKKKSYKGKLREKNHRQ